MKISPLSRKIQQAINDGAERCDRCGKPKDGYQAALNPQVRSTVPRSMRDIERQQFQTRKQAGLCTCGQDEDAGDETKGPRE